MGLNHDKPRLLATFRPQLVEHDQCVNIEAGKVEFDVTLLFLSKPFEEVIRFTSLSYASDSLADGLPQREDHDGPFEVDDNVDDWLESHGLALDTLIPDDWDALRKLYACPPDYTPDYPSTATTVVVIRSDNLGEDESYVVGAFHVPVNRVEAFTAFVDHTRETLIEEMEATDGVASYEDEDLFQAIIAAGYESASVVEHTL